jgi:hypothetical protein
MSSDTSLIPAGTAIIAEIYAQLQAATANELVLEQSWMRLGRLLMECKATESWRVAGFESWERFMMHLRERFKRGRTQLWSYLTVAEKLLPFYSAELLEEIGISKALELKRGIVQGGGKALPQAIIDAARSQDTGIKEVRAMVAQACNLAADEKGSWFDFGGSFLTAEEKQEFVAAVKLTLALLSIKKDVPEHIQQKEIILSWMREFVGTHNVEVYGPSEPINTPARLLGASNV